MLFNIGVVDAESRWRTLARFAWRRLLKATPKQTSRFGAHNFFRTFAI
jgi:hypothetical protein